MATDPKKDEFRSGEISDEQLEGAAGGNKVPVRRLGKDLPARELSDSDLEGVAGGRKIGGATEKPYPTRKGDITAQETD